MGRAKGRQGGRGARRRGDVFPGFVEFRDEEDAPFYESSLPRFAGAEATAAEVLERFSAVVFGVMDSASRRPLRMGHDDLVRWHKAIFATTFPHQAGQVRPGPTWFGVRWREHGRLHGRMIAGADPTHIRPEMRAAFAVYNAELEGRAPQHRSTRDALTAAATLYTDLLHIHPFEDGNLRASFPALQGALMSLGTAAVNFEDAVAAHDEAIGWALHPESEKRTVEPFVELMAERIREAARRGWRGVR